MEKLKTRNEYVGCNGKCRYYADTKEAYSYKHWCFVKEINGKMVFNWYNYSSTTTKHQWSVYHLLKELGIKIDITVSMNDSLTMENFKTEALESFYRTAIYKMVQNHTKRIRKKTIETNKKDIEILKGEIKLLKELGAEFSFKRMLRLYKQYKARRDRKEVFLIEAKNAKGKIYKNGAGERYLVKRYNIERQILELKALKDKKDQWGRNVVGATIGLNSFQRDFTYCPLSNAVNA